MITDRTAERIEFAIRSILEDEGIPFEHIADVTIWGVPVEHMPDPHPLYNPKTGGIDSIASKTERPYPLANIHAYTYNTEPITGDMPF